jgi:hypothetical protein
LALSFLFAAMAVAQSNQAAFPQTETRQPTPQQLAALPLTFEKNMGQVDKRASYLARLNDYTLFLTGSDSVLVHSGAEQKTASALKLHWLGASDKVTPQGDGEVRGKSNYLIGNDHTQWHSDVPNYQRIREDALYPGVDLVYYGNHEQLEYDLMVAAGADPGAIKLSIDGAKSLSIDKKSGDLVILDEVGSELRLRKPVVYQQDGERKNSIDGSYLLSANNSVAFALGAYDRSKALVIDPTVVYSTLFGATTVYSAGDLYPDQFAGITVDNNGFVYLLEIAGTPDLPTTTGAYQTACNIFDPGTYPAHFNSCSDFFVAKFDPTQSGAASLVYATYIGGTSSQDTAYAVGFPAVHALAVDADGDVYFTGHVESSDYPTTSNAYTSYTQSCATIKVIPGSVRCDVGGMILTKLDPTGSTLLYSTYFSTIYDVPYAFTVQSAGIAVDGNEIAYVWGLAPTGLPTTDGSTYSLANTSEAHFVAAFNTTATAATASKSLVYAEYFPMRIYGIAADPLGNVVLGGCYSGPYSSGFSSNVQTITLNGYLTTPQITVAGVPLQVGEVVKLNPQGVNTYATLVGTSAGCLNSISVNAADVAYTGGEINGGPYIYAIDTTQTGASSLLYSTLVANDNGGEIYDVSDNGEGLVAFSGVGYDSNSYHLVNALTQPTSVPARYDDPFAGIIDTTTGKVIFLSFIDGVNIEYPIDVILRRNLAEPPPNYLYIGGIVANASTFLPVAGVSYQATYAQSLTENNNPPFFYEIAVAPPPEVTVTPSPLNFGNQCINTTSATQTVTATNIGPSAITMDTVTASAPFTETDNCITSSPLAGAPAGQTTGGSCKVSVAFAPTTAGPFSGTLTLTDSDSSSPQKVTLNGAGIQTLVTLTPSTLSFSTTEGGTSAVQTIKVTNTGAATISVSTIQITGTNAADFSATNNCPATLTPSPASGSSCIVSLTFNPPGVVTDTAQLVVTDTDQCTQQTAPLSGNGTVPAPIVLGIGETIHVTDTPAIQSSQSLKIVEIIHTTDTLTPIPLSKQLNIVETIHATDALSPIPLAKILNIAETIHTVDSLAPIQRSAQLNIAETIYTTEALTSLMNAAQLNLAESIHVTDGVTMPVPALLNTTLQWSPPLPISYGTTLTGLLNATVWSGSAVVPGNFVFTAAPEGGSASTVTNATVLDAGNYKLGVAFTPANQADFAPTTGSVALTVNAAPQTIAFTDHLPASATYSAGLTYPISASGGGSGNPVTLVASGQGTLNNGTLAITGSGTVTITANQAGNANYDAAAQATQSITINPIEPTATPTFSVGAGTYTQSQTVILADTTPGAVIYYTTNDTKPTTSSTMYTNAITVSSTETIEAMATASGYSSSAVASAAYTITPPAIAPTLTWASPAAIPYGTALDGTQLNATATNATGATLTGTFTYAPTAGTVLAMGTHTLSVIFTPTDTKNYLTATAHVSLTVNAAGQSITLTGGTTGYAHGVVYGTAPLTLTAKGGASGNPVVFTVVSGPGTLSGNLLTVTGAGTIAIAANQAGNSDYAAAPEVVENIVVQQALPAVGVTASTATSFLSNAVTFTATVTSAASKPSGSVTFLDGGTALGAAVPLVNGVAALTTSSLGAGTHAIVASYGSDANFLAASSSAFAEFVEDFAVITSVSNVTQTLTPGSSAVFTFTVTPQQGGKLPTDITLSLSGLPAGATYSFSPATLKAGSGPVTVTLTIKLAQSAATSRPLMTPRRLTPLALGLLLLPFVGRLRRASRHLRRALMVLLLLSAGVAATLGVGGCGASSGYFGQQPQTYTVTVTGTSGALSHSATFTLIVE